MAEIEGAIGRQFQSLSIVFVCAVNTKLASLFRLEFSLQIHMVLAGRPSKSDVIHFDFRVYR
jgi:hypothetical protein